MPVGADSSEIVEVVVGSAHEERGGVGAAAGRSARAVAPAADQGPPQGSEIKGGS